MSSAPAPPPAAASGPAPAASGNKKETKGKSKAQTAVKAGATQAKPAAKRKKPASKTSSAASTQAVLNEARAAQIDLAQQRATAAAKKADPLWYRIEDVLPAIHDGSAMVSKTSVLPEQLQVVETALKVNGLARADVTPQAMACLLEQARRFALELITDAQDYAYSAQRSEVTRADLLLAAEMRADHPVAVSTQLPKLNLVAQSINRVPLPAIPIQCYSGVLLPPKEHQLTARTYDIVSAAHVARKMVQEPPMSPRRKMASNQPGYGATKGRQIPIKLKDQQNIASQSEGPQGMDISPTSAGAPPASTGPSPPAPTRGAPGGPTGGMAPPRHTDAYGPPFG